MTSVTKEVQATVQDTLSHPSGALKMPGTPDFPDLHIWFPDCQCCRHGIVFHSYHWNAPGGEWQQCPYCSARYFRWFKEHKLVRYVILRPNYPTKLRVDHSKTLEKSNGRVFYHEVDYRECESAHVEAYALDADGKKQEQLRIEGAYSKSFSTMAEASVWICQQLGGSLHTFWLS